MPSLPSCPVVPSELQRARATSLFRFILTRHKSPAMSEFVHRKTTQLPPRRTRVGWGGGLRLPTLDQRKGESFGSASSCVFGDNQGEQKKKADCCRQSDGPHPGTTGSASPGWKRCPPGPQTSLNKKGWAGNYIWGHHPPKSLPIKSASNTKPHWPWRRCSRPRSLTSCVFHLPLELHKT